jgi:hypothetical protein
MNVKTLTLEVFEPLLIFLGTIIASSGFWMYMIKKVEQRDLTRKLLIGLAHDRITYLSMLYIERGYVTQDEYENLCKFLFEPYCSLGGNGTAKRLISEVDKLPITPSTYIRKEEHKDV